MIAVMLALSLLMTSTRASGVVMEGLVSKDAAAAALTMTDLLRDYLSTAKEDERIPVTIELVDDIDMEKVEQRAYVRAQLSSTELAIMNADTSSLSEAMNEAHQKIVMELQDRIAIEKHAILSEHYGNKNAAFISSAGLSKEEYGSVGILTSFIREVWLTPAQIRKLAANPEVVCIDYVGGGEWMDFASIDDTYHIVNGNVCVEKGYVSSGVRVGLIESGHPKLGAMGSDSGHIIKTNSGDDTDHATATSGIIRKFAPLCTIYSRTASSGSEVLDACTKLINSYNVKVINISYGYLKSSGTYNIYSREMDQLVKGNGVSIVVASGNGSPSNDYINALGLSPNVITVGSVHSTGRNPGAAGAFTQTDYSLYREDLGTINKPDVCAPGNVSIYSYSDCQDTSFAAAHVTGTVVQMIYRNGSMTNQPQTLKAALMASASYNAGSSMSYVTGTSASNQEGAGVIDAGFCHQVARNGSWAHADLSSASTSFTYDVYCEKTTVPFRIACAWEALSANGATNITDYDMRIYKDGTLVTSSVSYASSSGNPKANYEIIELGMTTLAKYGAGYYQVQIKQAGDFYGTGTVRIGLAWEQR